MTATEILKHEHQVINMVLGSARREVFRSRKTEKLIRRKLRNRRFLQELH